MMHDKHVIRLTIPCIFAAEYKKPIYTVICNCNHAFFPIIVIIITFCNLNCNRNHSHVIDPNPTITNTKLGASFQVFTSTNITINTIIIITMC